MSEMSYEEWISGHGAEDLSRDLSCVYTAPSLSVEEKRAKAKIILKYLEPKITKGTVFDVIARQEIAEVKAGLNFI
ncbi:MAG: hypothetical protein J7525_19665 [Roseofilum sp. SID3]|uniref:hypothetical protein n=1 Tax=Roseofilum sp. SID3 TaxID=2821499 RepID=UPI001B07C79B|nr:hypothetical protein [Roseofilum sp. SID3]MBP0015314.1 hypothetical protein [Roseofilum sp. SID3]